MVRDYEMTTTVDDEEESIDDPAPTDEDGSRISTSKARPRVESVCCPFSHHPSKVELITTPRLKRTISLPSLPSPSVSSHSSRHLVPNISPRSLRLSEVRSWKLPNVITSPQHPNSLEKGTDVDEVLTELSKEILAEPAAAAAPVKKPILSLKLKLEEMPSKEEAEHRAQRAANRLIKRQSKKEAASPKLSSMDPIPLSLRLSALSDGSGNNDSSGNSSSEDDHRLSSQWSPNHGMLTTRAVSVSEAGISSPDATFLHLKHDLVRVREVGRGACGVVHKAIHVPTLNIVAVKDVPVYGKGQRRQMVRELHALYSNLVPISTKASSGTPSSSSSINTRSPFIVDFYDAFVDKTKNCVSLVMQYMDVGSLQDIVLCGGCQNEVVLGRMAACILQGLRHIHDRRMVHRDIKPHNLLMNRRGEVKISDFGLARTLNDNVSQTKTFVGTLLFMSPERIGGGDYSYACDIWSFGLSLMSVALGKYPLPTQDGFFGLVDSVSSPSNDDDSGNSSTENYLKLPKDQFSAEFCDFMDKCLVLDPKKRSTASELLSHPFVLPYNVSTESSLYLSDWKAFIHKSGLCEDPETEVAEIATATYDRILKQTLAFPKKRRNFDFGIRMLSRFQRSSNVGKESSSSTTTICPVEKSLQLGLAAALDIPKEFVYSIFENTRLEYAAKLVSAQQCLSPQSWTASPGVARRHQLFGSSSSTNGEGYGLGTPAATSTTAAGFPTMTNESSLRPSFLKRLQGRVKKTLGRKKK